MVKRKLLSTEPENEKLIEVKAAHIDEVAIEDDYAGIHYMRPHWARETMDTPVRIGDVDEPIVVLMSMDFYKKGKWPINMKHRYRNRPTLLRAGDVLAPRYTQ